MGGSLFGKPQEKNLNVENTEKEVESVAISNITRRLRVLEERIYNLQKKLQVTEKGLIETSKSSFDEIKLLNSEVAELKATMSEIKDKINKIIEELENKANQNEFLVFKKYLELWRPVNFVTKSQVEAMIRDAIKRKV